ncbi:hypothetical protein [Coprobacter secundus]|uniref:hypothetical protein n=1 Tax=Coprobacter secundus TaxID=1501392 RepID=UPI0023F9CB27|nr:hypothetical protein [Coprobacter secundus]
MTISKGVSYLFIAIGVCWAYTQGGLFGALGIGAVGYVVYDFFLQRKSWLPIGELALLLGGLQWIVSPFFSYIAESNLYRMSQPCDEYMMYTVSMYIAFMTGFYMFRPSLSLSRMDLIKTCSTVGKLSNILICVGLLFMFVPISMPALLFIKTLVINLFFIGFIIRMYMKPEKATMFLLLALGIQLLNSIRLGMFHELLVWGIFMMMAWFNIHKVTLKKRILIFVLTFIGIFILQTVKSTYRQAIWYNDYSGSKVELFFSLLINNAININEVQSETKESTVARYNQGWIISRIYANVPQKHDYFYGRTFVDAFNSTLVPRFLFPDKKGAGEQSRSDFIDMTGYQLSRGTSMGLSILGESYGNFGIWGGIGFMFFWGWFITKVISLVDRFSKKDFLWVMFLPIICFNLIKAEISMMSVLNWTVKSFLFVWIVIYLLRHLVTHLQPIVEDNDDKYLDE